MEEKRKKLEELLNDREGVTNVFVEDVDATLANLAARGIDITKEELAELATGVSEGMQNLPKDSELSDEDLENVAGGLKIGFFSGYKAGMDDANNGICGSTNGGWLYKLGYKSAQRIWGC